MSSECWNVLHGMLVLLQPLKEATDDCQSDKATLISFYNAFNYMKNEMKNMININHILKQVRCDTNERNMIDLFYVCLFVCVCTRLLQLLSFV